MCQKVLFKQICLNQSVIKNKQLKLKHIKMGIGISAIYHESVANSQGMAIPGGYNYCSQDQVGNLFYNFADYINENVTAMEYCFVKLEGASEQYKVSLVVDPDDGDEWYDHYNLSQAMDGSESFTVLCEFYSYTPQAATPDC